MHAPCGGKIGDRMKKRDFENLKKGARVILSHVKSTGTVVKAHLNSDGYVEWTPDQGIVGTNSGNQFSDYTLLKVL